MAYGSLQQAHPHRFYFGPEFLNLSLRTNVDDIHLSGSRFFAGMRFGYEYLKPCAFYAGVDFLGAGSDADFKARLDDEDLTWQKTEKVFGNIELRLGYTYFKCVCMQNSLLLTPFLGIGMYDVFPPDHYNEQGFSEDLPYVTGGLHLRYSLCYAFDIGLNGKALRTFSSEEKFKFLTRTIKSHRNFWGGEIGVPMIWHIGCTQRWDFQLEPYYLRISGNVYGVRTLFGYHF